MGAVAVISKKSQDSFLENIEVGLEGEGFDVVGFLSTKYVEKLLQEEEVDMLVVDRDLIDGDGLDFIHSLRKKGYQNPAILLSKSSKKEDIIDGFLKGVDDYIYKPFNMLEFICRIKAILKRTKTQNLDNVVYKDILIKQKSRRVFVNKEEIILSKLEFTLLLELIKNKHIVLSRDYLIEYLWGNSLSNKKSVDTLIHRLKSKLKIENTKDYIKSVRGIGYILQ